MTREEILFMVQFVTGVCWSAMNEAKSGTALKAKYIAIVIMYEEGYKPGEIAETIKRNRSLIYSALERVDELITGDQEFKNMYLACIKYLADLEDKAA